MTFRQHKKAVRSHARAEPKGEVEMDAALQGLPVAERKCEVRGRVFGEDSNVCLLLAS